MLSGYVRIRQDTSGFNGDDTVRIRGYIRILQNTSGYIRIHQDTEGYYRILPWILQDTAGEGLRRTAHGAVGCARQRRRLTTPALSCTMAPTTSRRASSRLVARSRLRSSRRRRRRRRKTRAGRSPSPRTTSRLQPLQRQVPPTWSQQGGTQGTSGTQGASPRARGASEAPPPPLERRMRQDT